MQYIISRLSQLNKLRWEITLDNFKDDTPFGTKSFTNIVATVDPHIPNRLVLAAHYDSKFFDKGKFVGATDSAVSVAMILDLVLTLDAKLQARKVYIPFQLKMCSVSYVCVCVFRGFFKTLLTCQ